MRTAISKISTEKLLKYLSINGWTQSANVFDERIAQCIAPDGSDSVLIPKVPEFIDYERSLARSLNIIAGYEKISIKRLCNKLISPSSDLLRFHISDEATESGAISFTSMYANIDYIKDLIASSCQDILNPSIFHSKVYTKEILEQLSGYRFGQTEIGSYILNILCPLGEYQYQLFDPAVEELPLSRRINLRLLGNINTVQRSVEDNSEEIIDNVGSGAISVNFLNSLSDIYDENKDSEVAISADWCKDVPLLEEPVSHVILNPRCIERLTQVVEDFTPKQEQNVPAHYFGKIINIGAEAEVGNRYTVDIKIATVGDGMRTVTVNATLDYVAFFSIVEKAFQEGADVKVSGIREITGRIIKLTNATIEMA